MSPEPIHVMPTADIKPHEASRDCWCVPKQDAEYPAVFVHNAFAEAYGEERDLA